MRGPALVMGSAMLETGTVQCPDAHVRTITTSIDIFYCIMCHHAFTNCTLAFLVMNCIGKCQTTSQCVYLFAHEIVNNLLSLVHKCDARL